MIEIEPLINGREYGWADVQVAIGGVPVTGITAINMRKKWKKKMSMVLAETLYPEAMEE